MEQEAGLHCGSPVEGAFTTEILIPPAADLQYVPGNHPGTNFVDQNSQVSIQAALSAACQCDAVPDDQCPSWVCANTAFVWMVWGCLPDPDCPVFQPEEISESLLREQNGMVFFIDYDGIYVGIEQLEISAEDMLAAINSIG